VCVRTGNGEAFVVRWTRRDSPRGSHTVQQCVCWTHLEDSISSVCVCMCVCVCWTHLEHRAQCQQRGRSDAPHPLQHVDVFVRVCVCVCVNAVRTEDS